MSFIGFVTELLSFSVVLYTIYGAFYRLALSPVAKFPGPKLAGLTFWYEFYFDVVKRGKYVFEIERMHEKYGPIVRINPYELHVRDNDLEWMNRLYPSVGKEVDKFWWSAGMFGNVKMAFGTIPHKLHKLRRNAFSKFFSTAAVRRLEPEIQAIVNSMCTRVEEDVRAGKKVNLVHAYGALTHDTITEYCFARPRDVLNMPDFAPIYYGWALSASSMIHVIKQFPWLIPTLNMLPDWWVRAMNPMAWDMRLSKRDYTNQVQRVMDGGDADRTSHITVFHALLNDSELPPSEKTRDRLAAEASSIVGAGTLTTSHMLWLTTFFVFSNPTIYDQLAQELVTVMPDRNSNTDLQTLEKLPYLTALIHEGLRMSYGCTTRLSRLHPNSTLQYGDWLIPPKTPVAMTPYILHRDPTIFPEPMKFDPDRWLNLNPKEHDRLTMYLFNFGKGSRQCAGMRLAYAEIYLTLAYFMRKLGDRVKLFETEYARDIEFTSDFFSAAPSPESRGVRIVSA